MTIGEADDCLARAKQVMKVMRAATKGLVSLEDTKVAVDNACYVAEKLSGLAEDLEKQTKAVASLSPDTPIRVK
jgi:hypothetical protein